MAWYNRSNVVKTSSECATIAARHHECGDGGGIDGDFVPIAA